MMRNPFFLLLFLLFQLPVCLQAQEKERRFSVAFYNVENLFDTLDDPAIDDEEFLPSGKNQWTGERYRRKLRQLSRVIDSLGGGPGILGLCEIENRAVLEDLVREGLLREKNYGIVHINSPDARGIDVALIYRKKNFTVTGSRAIPVRFEEDPGFRTRDILMVKGKWDNQELFVFVNHWPSRRGGEEESRPKRMAAARSLRRVTDSLLKANPDVRFLIMGDFNDEPGDASISKELGAGSDPSEKGVFNAMASLAAAGQGSHSYRETWNMLDQIMVSPGLRGGKGLAWVPESAGVYRPFWMHDRYAKHPGAPYRTYAGPRFIGGFSDHYPVFGYLRY